MLDLAALRLDHGLHPGAKLIDDIVDEGLGHILPCLRDPGLEMFHVSDGHHVDLRHQVGPDPVVHGVQVGDIRPQNIIILNLSHLSNRDSQFVVDPVLLIISQLALKDT